MRRTLQRLLVGAGLAVLSVGVVPAVPAAAAVVTVHVTGVVKMHIVDEESWFDDFEVCDYTQKVDFFRSSNQAPLKAFMVGHCGGEVRVEVDHFYEVSDHPAGIIDVHAFGRLYEGTDSHTTTDLEDTGSSAFSFDSGLPESNFFKLRKVGTYDSSTIEFVLKRVIV